MREKEVERKLREEVKKKGGVALKFVSPGMSGVPDRIILLPGGQICFVELKALGKKPRPLQLSRHAMLRRLGFEVFVVDSVEGIEEVLHEMESS